MSHGIPLGFGAMPIPNADPDDQSRLFRRLPFDPAQAPGLLKVGDPTGAAGAVIHQPGSRISGAGLGGPAIAMDEAETQRMEQQAGMMPGSAAEAPRGLGTLPPGDIAALFDRLPMGAPQGFSGTSGTIVPDQAAARDAPLPPARPSEEELAGPKPAPRVPFGGLPSPAPVQPSPAPADLPAQGAVTAQGQMPAPQPTAPAATSAQPAAAGPSALQHFGTALGDNSDVFLGLGAGLLSGRGASGWAKGVENIQRQSAINATTDLARQKQALELREVQQKAIGQNATVEALVKGGHAREDATRLVQAAVAGNREPLQNALTNLYPKNREAPAGYEAVPGGGMRFIPGGPEDPAVKQQLAQSGAAGAAAGKPADDPKLVDVQQPDGSTVKMWLRPGETAGQAVGAPAGPDKPAKFDTESRLRTEFAKGIGTFADVHDSYGRVIAATRQREGNPQGVSPASDIALVFGYMKMLDPGSVVREGEYATAANAAGIPERVRNTYNKAIKGEFLTPEQRQDFVGQANELYGTARKNAEAVAGRYRNLAGQYGVDPDRSVFLPEAPVPPVVGKDRMRTGQPQPVPPTRSDLEAEARRRGLIR